MSAQQLSSPISSPYIGSPTTKKKHRQLMDSNNSIIRVFVRSPFNKIGKVLVINKQEWTFDDLLAKLSAKFEIQVTDVYLLTQSAPRNNNNRRMKEFSSSSSSFADDEGEEDDEVSTAFGIQYLFLI